MSSLSDTDESGNGRSDDRDALLEHILMEMDGRENRAEANQAICQNCGLDIVDDHTDDYVLHRVPEHGKSETATVFYCSRDCFNESFERLLATDGGVDEGGSERSDCVMCGGTGVYDPVFFEGYSGPRRCSCESGRGKR